MRASAALAEAIATASFIEVCPACEAPENRGLCHSERCRRQVLPVAKPPRWHREAHRGMYFLGDLRIVVLSPEGQKIERRQERKLAKRQEREARLVAASQGKFTRNRRSRTRAA